MIKEMMPGERARRELKHALGNKHHPLVKMIAIADARVKRRDGYNERRIQEEKRRLWEEEGVLASMVHADQALRAELEQMCKAVQRRGRER